MDCRVSRIVRRPRERAVAMLLACIAAGALLRADPGSAAAAGRVVHVPAGGDLQAALNTARAGSTIALAPGTRYQGTFILPAHDGDDWITLTTDGPMPDRRVTPADSGTLAILQSPSNAPALKTAPGAHRWRITGIEVAPNRSSEGTAIEIGSNDTSRAEDAPVDIVLDRLLVRGDPTQGQKRGIALHGRGLTLTRSYVADIKRHGQDTQAVWANNGAGPYTISDNYLEASGENIMFGGDTPHIDGVIPTDITIENNTIAKPLAWQQEKWDVKNLLELKSARHAVIRGNRMSGNWVSAQAGYAILFSPRNQYGPAPWTVVEDVTFENNIVTDVSSGINVAGDDNEHPSQRTTNVTIRNNIVVADRTRFGGEGRFMMLGRAPQRVVIDHNTTITNGSSWIYTYKGGSAVTAEGLVVRDNLGLNNAYGFMGEGVATGKPVLARYYPDAVFEGNVLAGGRPSDYPPGNLFPTVEAFKAQFVDFAAGDYRLKPGSTFGDRGAHVTITPRPDAHAASAAADTTRLR